MTLREMHDYLTLIYKAGWDDCLEGRKFDPKIPKYLELNLPDIERGHEKIRGNWLNSPTVP